MIEFSSSLLALPGDPTVLASRPEAVPDEEVEEVFKLFDQAGFGWIWSMASFGEMGRGQGQPGKLSDVTANFN